MHTHRFPLSRSLIARLVALCGGLLCLFFCSSEVSWASPQKTKIPAGMVRIAAGTFAPFYPPSDEETEVKVDAFYLDKEPITNSQFLRFVQKSEKWQKGKASRLFVDAGYLRHWHSPVSLGKAALAQQPVVNVSWFAAKAYCKAQGKRLPLEKEWEFAALASKSQKDGSNDPAWLEQILAWYSTPNRGKLPLVGQTAPNYYGVYDLHGLIWEWVYDFNSSLVSSDARKNKQTDKVTFCGAGALDTTTPEDYATFMRIAFRSSLKANYSSSSLGFRCALSLPESKAELHKSEAPKEKK